MIFVAWLVGQIPFWTSFGLAAGAGSIPIIIHLLNRRRFRRVVWAAMDWLLAANRKNARRVQFEQWLLLLIRAIAITLAILAITRPLLREGSLLGTWLGRQPSLHVLVLDRSLSMQQPAGETGQDAWTLALDRARVIVQGLGTQDRVAVILAGNPVDLLGDGPTSEHGQVLQALAGLEPGFGETDWAAALARASELISASDTPATAAHVWLVSDLSGDAFAEATAAGQPLRDGLRMLESQASLHLAAVGGTQRENAAIVDVALLEALTVAGSVGTAQVTVRNFGERELRGLSLEVFRETTRIGAARLPDLLGGQQEQVSVTVGFDAAGSQTLRFVLLDAAGRPLGDALSIDDTRSLAVEARGEVPILLVDGLPGETRADGTVRFLFAATGAGVTRVVPKDIPDTSLPSEELSRYAAVAMSSVSSLPQGQWDRLAAYARDGGLVLIYLGERINIDNYNRFGFANGEGVLTAPLEAEVVATAGNTPQAAGHWNVEIADLTSPIVRPFVEHRTGGLFTATISRVITPAMRRLVQPDMPAVQTLLRLNDGTPLLLTRSLGRGRVVLFTSAAAVTISDNRWSGLAGRPDWASLLRLKLEHYTHSPATGRSLLAGQPIEVELSGARAAGQRVFGPDGQPVAGQVRLRQTPGQLVATTGTPAPLLVVPTVRPGTYRIELGPPAEAEKLMFAVNPPPAESRLDGPLAVDLERNAGVQFASIFQAGQGMVRDPTQTGASELAIYLLYIALGLLLLETLLAQRFGHHAG